MGSQQVRWLIGLAIVTSGAWAQSGVETLSPLLRDGLSRDRGPRTAVVEWSRRSSPASIRRAALDAGAAILENPDLLDHQLLIRGSREAILQLSRREEVEWIYPAAPELEQGLPLRACAGAQLVDGKNSGRAAASSDGWDGPGLGRASLTYIIGQTPSFLSADAVRGEIERALQMWTEPVEVDFSPAPRAGLARSLEIVFLRGNHGDGYAFDGPGGVLAHTFYPPPNPESIAGDLHLDLDESWRIGGSPDVFSVTLHEIGHALGLGHADDPNAVMYPWYRRVYGLRQADIDAVRQLYAARGQAPPPATPPPTTPPPAPPPAAPPPSNPSDRTPPSLVLTSPASSTVRTTAPSIILSGTASDDTAVTAVRFTTNAGASGACAGTARWASPSISLVYGTNIVTITAEDAAGNRASRTVFITRR